MIKPEFGVLRKILNKMGTAKILCLGDVMLDTYRSGNVQRISPECPCPIFEALDEQSLPGGAANVACNVASLGGHCILVGVVGDDEEGETLRSNLDSYEDITTIFVIDELRPTTHKIRHTVGFHQILRVDREIRKPILSDLERKLLVTITSYMTECDVLILSDYAKGTLTDLVISEAIKSALLNNVKIVVDPKSVDLSRYAGASVLTPNLIEASTALGMDMTDNEKLLEGGKRLLSSSRAGAILITCGANGMMLLKANEVSPLHVRSRIREVYDVVGAGDTVVAALALALGAGACLSDATWLASMAAEVVVGKRGTATAMHHELEERLSLPVTMKMAPSENLILSKAEALSFAVNSRAEGKKVGFTNGVFDLLHPGHISLLEYAKNFCDRLIVGLNSDASVMRLGKGPSRPVNSEFSRAALLSAIKGVDAVVVFDEITPKNLIHAMKPDVLVKGADYALEDVVGAEFVLSRGGIVELAPILEGESSTSIIQHLDDLEGAK